MKCGGVQSGSKYQSLGYLNCWTLTRADRGWLKNFRDRVEFCSIQLHCRQGLASAISAHRLTNSLTFSPWRDRVCGRCYHWALRAMVTLLINASLLLPVIHY